MNGLQFRRLTALGFILLSSAAAAQQTAASLDYRSSFDGYQVFSDQAVAPWRKSYI